MGTISRRPVSGKKSSCFIDEQAYCLAENSMLRKGAKATVKPSMATNSIKNRTEGTIKVQKRKRQMEDCKISKLSIIHERGKCLKLNSQQKCHSKKIDHDSDGHEAVPNPHHSTPPAKDVHVPPPKDLVILAAQLAPERALRAATLKHRFADTIFKATREALLTKDQKSNPRFVQQEKERFKGEMWRERVRIEATVKSVEPASQGGEVDVKMQRERDRKAARMALEMMEKNVEIDDNAKLEKDLELLVSGYLFDQSENNSNYHAS